MGLDNSGKTEVAYKICGAKRDEFLQTKGCRVFNTVVGKVLPNLIYVECSN